MKTLLSLLLLSVATPSFAQICAPMKVIASVAAKRGQTPLWSGMAPNKTDRYVVLSNPKTGEWAAVYVGSKGIGCILAEGTESKPVFGEPI